MQAHTHMSPTHVIFTMASIVAVFGTLHLLALSSDNPAARAWLALNF